MFRIVEDRTDGGVQYYRLIFNENFVEIREDTNFGRLKYQLAGFTALCEKNVQKPQQPEPTANDKTVIVADISDAGAMQTLREAVVEAVKQNRVVTTEYTQINACPAYKTEIENRKEEK